MSRFVSVFLLHVFFQVVKSMLAKKGGLGLGAMDF